MYSIVKNVIMAGRYELTDMLRKLDTLWVQGDLTDEQKTELEGLARDHADPAMTNTLSDRMDAVEARLDKLEKTGPAEDWPEYQEGRNYAPGDKITFEGKHYVCKRPEGTACVWTPAVMPNYWEVQ